MRHAVHLLQEPVVGDLGSQTAQGFDARVVFQAGDSGRDCAGSACGCRVSLGTPPRLSRYVRFPIPSMTMLDRARRFLSSFEDERQSHPRCPLVTSRHCSRPGGWSSVRRRAKHVREAIAARRRMPDPPPRRVIAHSRSSPRARPSASPSGPTLSCPDGLEFARGTGLDFCRKSQACRSRHSPIQP